LSLILLFQAGGPPQKKSVDDQEPVSLWSHLVLLNAAVTGKEAGFVPGLKQTDFTVLEDGARQEIAFFGSESTPFAVAILLDVSGSMERLIRIAIAAARNFADKLRDEDVMAVYVFADRVAKVQDFGADTDLTEDLWQIRPEGYTALYDGIAQAAQDLEQRTERRRALLVLTDGADTRSQHSLNDAISAALNASVTVYSVHLVYKENSTRPETAQAAGALRQLAEKTGGKYLTDPGGARMYQAFGEVVDELSHQYTIGYFPSPEKLDGKWHNILVEVSKPGMQVRTRQGYRAPKRNQ
jgi:VWFA-related protein